MAYLGDIISTLKNGMTSMNEGVNAVDRIQKAVPQSMLSEYAPNVHWNDEFPPEYNDGVSGMTWAQVMVNQTRESMRSGDGKLDDKFAPGFFRILLTECGFLDDHRNDAQEEKQRRLEGLYKLFIEDHDADKALMSYNFVPMAQTKSGPKAKDGTKAWIYEDFENRYGKTLDDRLDDDKRKTSETVLADHGYKVIEIKDFKTAKKYGDFTGGEGGRSKLCYTRGEITMRNQFGGLDRNRVWLAYKPDFKKIEPVVGEGNPYDEYGLSMIWVFVAPDGSMPYVNVRWNHANSGAYDKGGKSTDHCLSMAEVVEITGHDFKKTFLPYKVEEEDEIEHVLGEGLSIVKRKYTKADKKVGERYNICHDDNAKDIVFTEWFDFIYSPKDGFVIVERNEKRNLFDLKKKELVFQEWVDYIKNIEDGFVEVQRDGKRNLFDMKKKELVFPEWVDNVYYSEGGLAKVIKNGKYNIFDLKKKELVIPEWVDFIYSPKDGFVRIVKDGKWNLFNLKMKEFMLPEWFDFIYSPEDGFVEVQKDEKYNMFDMKTNKLVLPEWVNRIGDSEDGFVRIEKDEKYNMFDFETKELVFQEWIGYIYSPKDGFTRVRKDEKWNLFDLRKKELVFPEWVDCIEDPKDGFVCFQKDKKRQKIKLSDLRKTESRRRCEHRICECCGRRIR